MKTRTIRNLGYVVAILGLLLAVPSALRLARAADDSAHSADDAAVKQVVAGFSNGWNTHDSHAMCASLADDVEWVSWRGEISASRKQVEDDHATLFADLYKNSHRTDTVKSIKYLGADLALVDDYWTMTGARTREGADWPYRAGYVSMLMSRRNGRWMVIISHTADFNAKAPAAK
jgi:uncharacterized protein (TIGR02246 family)